MNAQTTGTSATEALAERLFQAGVAAMELCTVYLGVRLGLYQALAGGPLTSAELAAEAGLAERYAREWLQAQAVAGLVGVDGDEAATASFSLADGVEDVLVDEAGPAYLGGLAASLAAVGGVLPALAGAYRSGAGLPYAEYGPDAVSAQAALNRPAFANLLVPEWLPAMPAVLERLRDRDRPARVADFACGAGWAAIELAKAFDHVRVDGIDNDEASIAAARDNATAQGVAGRIGFEVRDLGDQDQSAWAPAYDVAFLFECVHDLPRPVEALANVRASVAPGGTVIVMEERAAETLTAPGDEVERFLAAASALWCLPQGLVGPDPEPVGTLIRPATMRALAAKAGYRGLTILPVEHPVWRFYELEP